MGSLQVGYFGNGTFNQTGGTNTVLSDFVFVVGRHVGANGVYNLTGGEASHSGLAGFTLIGEDGTGVMNVGGTGVFNAAANMYIGWTATGDGTLNINDGGTVNTPGIVFGPGTGRLNFDRADTYTFSAPISGGDAGRTSVTKNGTGTVTLSGTNTYAGATVIEKGTLIAGNGSALGSSAVTLNTTNTGANNTSLLVDASGGDVVISNAINVANQGTGDTSIGSSALNANSYPVKFTGPISLAKDVTLVSAPGLAGAPGNRTDFSGGISGTGDVTISTATNSRVIFMGDANTFDGDVIITPGSTLQLSDGEPNNKELIPVASTVDIGAGAALTLAKGGNSETIGGLTGSGTVQAVAGADTLVLDVAEANSLVFDGPLTGTLALTKRGLGMQTLGGNSSFSGGTVLDAGKLVTTSQTALGTGAVQLLGGTLELQSQLDIASLFWNGASTIAMANPAGGQFVNIGGSLTLTNGINNFDLTGAVLPRSPVKLMTSANMSTYSTNDFGVLGLGRYKLLIEGDSLFITDSLDSFVPFAVTPNQANVAAALNSFIGSGGDRGIVVAALDSLPDSQFPAAFEQMMPSQYASLPTMAFNVVNALNSSMFQRLWVIRINGRGFSSSGISMNPMQAEMGGTDDMGVFAINPSKDKKWSSFVDGNGVFANASSTGSVQNYRSQSGGVSTGAAYSWTDAFATGVYVGYQGLQAEYNNGRTIDNAVRFGAFGTYDIEDFYFNALVGGAYHGYTVNRYINFGGLNRTATGRPGAGEFDLALGTGYDFDIGNFSWGPFTTMQYTYLAMQGFTEAGADSLNLDVDPYNSSSLLYTLGAQAAYNWKVSDKVIITPTAFAGWQHEFLQNGYTINSTFATGGPAAPFNYNTSSPARDNFYGGVGVTVGVGESWQGTFIYSASAANQDNNSQNLYLGLGYKF